MNPNGCPPGFASDELASFSDVGLSAPSCAVPLATFHAVIGSAVVIMCALFLASARVWIAKQRMRRDAGQQGFRPARKQHPVALTLQATSLLALVLLWGLCAPNVANEYNGASIALLGGIYVPFALSGYLYLARLLKLGVKVLPLFRKESSNNSEHARLSRFDCVLYALYGIALSCVASMAICAWVIAFVPGLQEAAASGFFMSCSLGDVFFSLGCIYQAQRIVRILQQHQRALLVDNLKSQTESLSPILAAVQQIRNMQFISLVIGFGEAGIWASHAFHAIPFYYYWTVLHQVALVMASLPIQIVPMLVARRRRQREATRGAASHLSVSSRVLAESTRMSSRVR